MKVLQGCKARSGAIWAAKEPKLWHQWKASGSTGRIRGHGLDGSFEALASSSLSLRGDTNNNATAIPYNKTWLMRHKGRRDAVVGAVDWLVIDGSASCEVIDGLPMIYRNESIFKSIQVLFKKKKRYLLMCMPIKIRKTTSSCSTLSFKKPSSRLHSKAWYFRGQNAVYR